MGESERGIHLGHDVQNSKIDCECRVLNWLDRTMEAFQEAEVPHVVHNLHLHCKVLQSEEHFDRVCVNGMY